MRRGSLAFLRHSMGLPVMASLPGFIGDGFDEDVAWTVTHGVEQPVAAGRILVREGEPANAVYVVLAGSFAVSSEGLGVEFLWRLGPGEVVGQAFPDPAVPPIGTVRAECDGAVLAIPRTPLDERLHRDAAFAPRLLRLAMQLTPARLRDLRARHAARPRPGAPGVPDDDEVAGLRVHEMIERLLRGDLL